MRLSFNLFPMRFGNLHFFYGGIKLRGLRIGIIPRRRSFFKLPIVRSRDILRHECIYFGIKLRSLWCRSISSCGGVDCVLKLRRGLLHVFNVKWRNFVSCVFKLRGGVLLYQRWRYELLKLRCRALRCCKWGHGM